MFRFLLLLGLSITFIQAQDPKVPTVGDLAPPIAFGKILKGPASAELTWEKLRGKVVVVDFWATWCGPCVASLPHWNNLVAEFRDQPVAFLVLSDENEDIVASFLKRKPIDSWVAIESLSQSARMLYGVRGIPQTFVVNQEGIIAAVTHPEMLKPEHLREVLLTKKCSLPPPQKEQGESDVRNSSGVVPLTDEPPLFELSIKRAGPKAPGRGTNVWSIGADRREIEGKDATLKGALSQVFQVRETQLIARANLPEQLYDFTLRVPSGGQPELERIFTQALQQTFGLTALRKAEESNVYILTSTGGPAPGLEVAGALTEAVGSTGRGQLKYESTTINSILPFLESTLGKPVVNETGLTNRFNIRVKWKLSDAELLLFQLDRDLLTILFDAKRKPSVQFSEKDQTILSGVKGQLTSAQIEKLPAESRTIISVLQRELAKPEKDRFEPSPAAVVEAIQEQLGLKLAPGKRVLDTLVIEEIKNAPTAH